MFENTYNDLGECLAALEDKGVKHLLKEASQYEKPYITKLIELCQQIADDFEDDINWFSVMVSIAEAPARSWYTVIRRILKLQYTQDMTKTFNTRYGIGKSRYVVNFHDGVNTHNDGSPFFNIRIFSNKRNMEILIKMLIKDGYTEA